MGDPLVATDPDDAIRELWRRSVAVIIANLENQRRDHRALANVGSQIAEDYAGRFLIELLQNASDQATKVGLSASTIVIARTQDALCIANQGAPFDEDGVDAITSLALSTKPPSAFIGNKGLGFKAVYHVTRAPEVFSAREAGRSVRELAWAFALEREPLKRTAVQQSLRLIVARELAKFDSSSERLRRQYGDSLENAIFEELAFAAPWQFPIPLTRERLELRRQEFDPEGAWLDASQTLVVLPVEDAARALVDEAIDELVDGSMLLFLPSVSRIVLVDRIRGVERTLERRELTPPRRLKSGATFNEIETSTTSNGAAQSKRWWIAKRIVGREAGSKRAAVTEGRQLKKRAQTLQVEGWRKVDAAPISVALPQTALDATSEGTLQPDGLFSIGLPTRQPTGTAFHIDGRFHGTISRKGVSLGQNAYNDFVFDQCVTLVCDLLNRLRAAGSVSARRCVTLAMNRSEGALAKAFRSDRRFTSGRFVLLADGKTFAAASALALPRKKDERLFETMATELDVGAAGFVLPEASLFSNSRELLETLPGYKAPPQQGDERFLKRKIGRRSLLEQFAARHRASGPAFWEPFVEWMLTSFSREELEKQRVLPVGVDELAAASQRVFLEPVAGEGKDDGEEINLQAVPADVTKALRFLDSRALGIRTGTGRDVSRVGRQLSPPNGGGLVSRPHREQLINEVVIPRVRDLSAVGNHALAISLLALAAEWIRTAKKATRERVDFDKLLVPTQQREAWFWSPASSAYVGDGWLLTVADDELLRVAVGDRRARLVAWSAFEPFSGGRERDWWVSAVDHLRVASTPRILEKSIRYPLHKKAYDNYLSINASAEPFEIGWTLWRAYLDEIRQRTSEYAGRRWYDIDDVCWVDGLENEASRAAVVKLILRNPARYEHRMETKLHSEGRDASRVSTLWSFAVRHAAWDVIPVSSDLASSAVVPLKDAWWVSRRERGVESVRLLPVVSAEFVQAEGLLKKLKIERWDDAAAAALLRVLQRLADFPPEVLARRPRPLQSLVTEVYTKLAARLAEGVELDGWLEKPILLARGDGLDAVALADVELVYVDDDPVRAALIPDFQTSWRLPAVREHERALVAELRRNLGETAVVLTSEADIDPCFVEELVPRRREFRDFLAEEFPDELVAVDIALLLAFGGRVVRNPDSDDFRDRWDRLRSLSLSFGEFTGPAAGEMSFYQRPNNTLFIREGASPFDVVEATWAVAGLEFHDPWEAYVGALRSGHRERFFRARRIDAQRREWIEDVVGIGSAARYAHLVPALHAIAQTSGGAIPDFAGRWREHTRSADIMATAVGHPDLSPAIREALLLAEEPGSLLVLDASATPVMKWQDSRAILGFPRWTFDGSVQAWSRSRTQITARLMAAAARAASFAPDRDRGAVELLSLLPPPDEIAHDRLDAAHIERHCARAARAALAGVGDEVEQKAFVDALNFLVNDAGRDSEDPIPKRDVQVYLEPEPRREVAARELVTGVTRVAIALAPTLGETLNDAVLDAEPLRSLLNGFWANRWSALFRLRRSIEATAPLTAQALSEQRAFRDSMDSRELWALFPHLGAAKADPTDVKPTRSVVLLGMETAESDVASELKKGNLGRLGEAIRASIDPDFDLPGLRDGTRSSPAPPRHVRGGGRGFPSGGNTEARRARELNGLLGEVFVLEQFRARLSNFDESCWRSENRALFGLPDGTDVDGCDFIYCDAEGDLTGRDDSPECYIEVKSTSGDGDDWFVMSINEWTRAMDCHVAPDKVYVIVRVRNVRDQPAVFDLIFDPIALFEAGKLTQSAQDMIVRVGWVGG